MHEGIRLEKDCDNCFFSSTTASSKKTKGNNGSRKDGGGTREGCFDAA